MYSITVGFSLILYYTVDAMLLPSEGVDAFRFFFNYIELGFFLTKINKYIL